MIVVGEEYIDYAEENEEVIKVGNAFFYIVIVKSLEEIKHYADNTFESTIREVWGEENHYYKPKSIKQVVKNCDGTFTIVFELDRID